MVSREHFKNAAKLAALNINKHGDTDIFPLPFENRAIFDASEKFVELICDYDDNFDDYLSRFSPSNSNALTPVSYFGFRWATQIDPIWNAYFLSCVIAIAERIESVRIPAVHRNVFSYRYKFDTNNGDLFDRNFGWLQFMNESLEKSSGYEYVVTCDISEFYPRIGHHRLENALQQVAGETNYARKIMSFLTNFSQNRSFGLPIGGPAARILSELTINQIDWLLKGARVDFTRFADDFHVFAKSREDAYRLTIFLSEKLFENQGLSLQKSKTRIMTSSEFRATSPLPQRVIEPAPQTTDTQDEVSPDAHEHARRLLSFSLRFDPYSPTAHDDYENLRSEIRKFDILGLLKEEISKSRVHVALSRKIVSAIRYREGRVKEDAVLSVVENSDVLYPIFAPALVMIDHVFSELSKDTQNKLIERIVDLYTIRVPHFQS